MQSKRESVALEAQRRGTGDDATYWTVRPLTELDDGDDDADDEGKGKGKSKSNSKDKGSKRKQKPTAHQPAPLLVPRIEFPELAELEGGRVQRRIGRGRGVGKRGRGHNRLDPSVLRSKGGR